MDGSRRHAMIYAALLISCVALAVSIVTALRGRNEPEATGAQAYVDQGARDQIDMLRRALADRDARLARLSRTPRTPVGAAITAEPPPATPPSDPGPRRYVHFEIPNPAVTVTQKADGTYDIRTTDPALAGSIVQVTAVTGSGDEDKLLLRIP